MSETLAQSTEKNPIALALVDVTELEGLRDPVVEQANSIVISDQATLEEAGAFLVKGVKAMLKKIGDSCGPVVAAAHAAHKAATTQRNELEAPLKEAERVVKGKIGAYQDEQERLARIEAKRLADEQAEAERKAKADEEAALAEAAALEEAGKPKEAEAALERATVEKPAVIAPPPRPEPQKVQDVSTRKVWKAEVTDPMALLRGVLDGKIPRNVLKIDAGKLNQLVRSLDGQVDYPGVRVTSERAVSARAS